MLQPSTTTMLPTRHKIVASMERQRLKTKFDKLNRKYKRAKRLSEPYEAFASALRVLDNQLSLVDPKWRKQAYK